MLRDNLVELIEPMLNSAGADPLALYIHTRTPASDDRLPCLKNPRPEGAESSLTESASSPFQAEPAQMVRRQQVENSVYCSMPQVRPPLVVESAVSSGPSKPTRTNTGSTQLRLVGLIFASLILPFPSTGIDRSEACVSRR